MQIIICMVVNKGITEARLKLLFYSIGQVETEGVVSVGTNKFVNYAWMLHMPVSYKTWHILIAELIFTVEKSLICLTLLSHKGSLLLFHLCNLKIYSEIKFYYIIVDVYQLKLPLITKTENTKEWFQCGIF